MDVMGGGRFYRDDPEKAALALDTIYEEDETSDRVQPAVDHPLDSRAQVPAVIYALIWMGLSSSMVISNKYILHTANFRYPILLSAWHTTCASIATQVLARSTSLINRNQSVQMTPRLYLQAIVPIGVTFGGSLIASNYAFLYLSVAFIEMLKAASPIMVFLIGLAFGLERFSFKVVLSIIAIACGLAVAAYGEIQFSSIGFAMQMTTITFAAVKLIMMQKLLQGKQVKMDPLTSLHYTAPVCAIVTLTGAIAFEVPWMRSEEVYKVGVWVLLGNTGLGISLSLSEVFLVGKTSGLSITLFGVLKSLLTVTASIALWHTPVTVVQACGYGLTLCALVCYKVVVKAGQKEGEQGSESSFKFGDLFPKWRTKPSTYAVTIASCLVLTTWLLVTQMR